MKKIVINGAVHDWINTCLHHQKNLDKKEEDYAKIRNYLDLDGCDNKKVIEILTKHENAWFEDGELIYETPLTAEQLAVKKEENQRGLDYMVVKINRAIENNKEIKAQVKIYLDHYDYRIEGLKL